MSRILTGLCLILTTQAFSASCNILKSFSSNISSTIKQMIVVVPTGENKAQILTCEDKGGVWKPAFPSMSGVIGQHGIAHHGDKKEGDGKTPAGLFPIGEGFGTTPQALHIDYRYITADDKFIDDVHHKHYNSWVVGDTDAKSYENMLIEPYQLGAVVNYNMNPTHPGSGSAIFIHIWRTPHSPTQGCVAMSKQSVSSLLHWLNKSAHPHVLIVENGTPK